jgi:hypothetical protein
MQTPAVLSGLESGTYAISAPVILQAGADGDAPPATPDEALKLMAGSTRVQQVRRIGVYWEAYGFLPSDTVDCAVWIERYTSQGVRKLANALRITRDLNTPIVVAWQETTSANRVAVIDGPVPIAARSLSIDVSQLPRGAYWLDVAAGLPGKPPVHARARLVLE